MSTEKPIYWVGTSYQDLLLFSVGARQQAGYQLHRIQNGLEPENWKLLSTIGAGVKEIRIKENEGIYRIIYVAKLEIRIYVLHAFQKKTQKIRKQDIDIAKVRYSAISQENPT
jgi:phage-related protein